MRERDPINDISVAEDVVFEVELGHRVFRCMSAENQTHHPRFIQGISDLFFLTDTSDDWSDMHWMITDDERYDYTLAQGLRALVAWTDDIEVAVRWLEAWERKEVIDWRWEEMVRQHDLEEWIISGGLDDEP